MSFINSCRWSRKEILSFYNRRERYEKALTGKFFGTPLDIRKCRVIMSKICRGKRRLVFDAGCGEGAYVYEIAKRGYTVVGYDISSSSMKGLKKYLSRKKLLGRVFLIVGSCDHLPFRNSSFDMVLCLDVLEHLFEPFVALKEIKRVMKPDSFMIITVPNLYHYDSLESIAGIIHQVRWALDHLSQVMRGEKKFKEFGGYNQHLHQKTPKGWVQMLRCCGMRIEETRAVFMVPTFFFDRIDSVLWRLPGFLKFFYFLEERLSNKIPFSFLGQLLLITGKL